MFELRPSKRNMNNQMRSYNPFREMEKLEKALWNNDFWNDRSIAEFKTDIKDNGNSFTLEADLPGFNKDDIAIDIDNDYLTISATRHSEHEDKDNAGNYVCCERSYGSYSRSFDVSNVMTDDISAKYDNGVLVLNMPKKDAKTPTSRRLNIE